MASEIPLEHQVQLRAAHSGRCLKRTAATGQGARRMMDSATLPRSMRPTPVRPWVPITMSSACSSPASRSTSSATKPSMTMVETSRPRLEGLLDLLAPHPRLGEEVARGALWGGSVRGNEEGVGGNLGGQHDDMQQHDLRPESLGEPIGLLDDIGEAVREIDRDQDGGHEHLCQ
jgi:hypothetical protein